jgi:hypothetical protein
MMTVTTIRTTATDHIVRRVCCIGVLPLVRISRAPDRGGRAARGLGALVSAHPLPQLLFDLGEIEGARRLTGRVLLPRLKEFCGHGLHRHDHEYP